MPDDIYDASVLALKPAKIPQINLDDEHRRPQRRDGLHDLVIVDLFPHDLLKRFSSTAGRFPGNREGDPWQFIGFERVSRVVSPATND
jgi:hypothetical protein